VLLEGIAILFLLRDLSEEFKEIAQLKIRLRVRLAVPGQ